MAARRARKGKKRSSAKIQPLIIGAVAIVLVALVLCSGVLKGGGTRSSEPTANFSIADYRRDGSRFASSGNSYVFDGRVENIETIGNDRVVCISIANNPDERLPLLVPSHANLRGINLTRGDRFLFETSCQTGQTPDGEQVKGVLIVKKVETR